MKRIKNKIFAIVFWQTRIGELVNKIYDLRIFYKYSFYKSLNTKENYEAFLTKQYHIIEKGLALPNPRANFGIEKIKVLVSVSTEYINKFGKSELTETIASTLSVYLESNSLLQDFNKDVYSLISNFISKNNINNKGGIRLVSPTTQFSSFEVFAKSRSSIRIFSGIDVDIEKIRKAIDIAKFAPSVCNRQSWGVHLYSKKEDVEKMLKCQDGNNGFGFAINKLIIVTGDAMAFTNLESNQIYIDGGLFSMSLLYALHSLGIGTCCLNLCVPYVKECYIKKIGNIHSSERLIMMIGIGHYDNNTKVAISNRKANSEILTEH